MMTTQSRINQMIREAQTKDFDAEVWRDRQTEWMELTKKFEEEKEYAEWRENLDKLGEVFS